MDAILAVSSATQRPHDFSEMVANEVDTYGRATVNISSNLSSLMNQKNLIQKTGLVATVRSLKDVFREDMCDCIFHWIEDISKASLNRNYLVLSDIICQALYKPWRVGTAELYDGLSDDEDSRDSESPIPPKLPTLSSSLADMPALNEDSYVLYNHSNLLGSKIPLDSNPLEISKIEPKSATSSSAPDFWLNDGPEPNLDALANDSHLSARVQYLIFFDIRLWRSLRNTLRDLYISVLVSNPEYKSTLGHCFAQLYPRVAELYILADREPECSIISNLSTQLFTTPSIATDLARYNYFSKFMAAIYTFFTEPVMGPPSSIDPNASIPKNSSNITNRRFGQLFHDIEYILNRNVQKELVSGNTNRIAQTADLLLLFQGICPLQRQKEKHVEYESNAWVSYFNCMPYIMQLAHVIALGSSACEPSVVAESIRTVSTVIASWAFAGYAERFKGQSEVVEPPFLQTATINLGDFESISISVVAFKVENELVSLHHPLHSFLSWLIEYGRVESADELRSLLLGHRQAFLSYDGATSEDILAVIFDYPLRVLVLLSQIQIGLWVRNGFNVRNQLHHYRQITLRDYAYTRDIFMMQVALVVMDPSTIMVRLMDRWSLLSWTENEVFDDSQRLYMIEQLLHLLIVLIMERHQLQGLSETDCKRRYVAKEIIQCLAFKPLSFSDICKTVPEYLTSEEMFETILKDMTTYKEPIGMRDPGLYSLKPEFYRQFDTHYLHFTSTKIEEGERAIKQLIHKRTEQPINSIVIEPPLEKIESGPFVGLSNFTRSLAFISFVFNLLRYITLRKDDLQNDGTLSMLLHLCHCAALDDLNVTNDTDSTFAAMLCRELVEEKEGEFTNAISQMYSMSMMNEFSACAPKIKRIITIAQLKNRALVDNTMRKRFQTIELQDDNAEQQNNDESEKERKKHMAKLRQEKVMAELQNQQKLFAQQNDGELGSDDEDDDMDNAGGEMDGDVWKFPNGQCILCRMPCDSSAVYGTVGYTMKTNVFRTVPFDDDHWVYEGYGSAGNLDFNDSETELAESKCSDRWKQFKTELNSAKVGPGFPVSSTERHPVLTSCCHCMHYSCYEQYVTSARSRANQLTRNTPEDISKNEFLCPLCKSINNTFVPILWKANAKDINEFLVSDQSYDYVSKLASGAISSDKYPDLDGIRAQAEPSLMTTYLDILNSEFEGDDDLVDVEIIGTVTEKELVMSIRQILERFFEEVDPVQNEMCRPYNSLPMIHRIHLVHNNYISSMLNVLAWTLSSLEISLRGVGYNSAIPGTILDQVRPQGLATVRVLSEFCKFALAFLAVKAAIAVCERHDINKWVYDLKGVSFEKMVNMIYVHCPVFGISPHTLMKIHYMAMVTKILAKLTAEISLESPWVSNPNFFDIPDYDQLSPEGTQALCDLIGMARSCLNTKSMPNEYIWNKPILVRIIHTLLVKQLTPFLRKCALLAYTINGAGYDTYDYMGFPPGPEAHKLCELLKFPSIEEVYKTLSAHNSQERALFLNWIMKDSTGVQTPLEYPGVIRLLKLSDRLDDFFSLSNHKLPAKWKELPTDPAVCLFCGVTVGLQYSEFSDQTRGECNIHVDSCGRNLGIFLLPKRSSMLLLKGHQGSYTNSPYLDLHGETDDILR